MTARPRMASLKLPQRQEGDRSDIEEGAERKMPIVENRNKTANAAEATPAEGVKPAKSNLQANPRGETVGAGS